MKKMILPIICVLLFSIGLWAQSPQPTTFVLTNEGGLIDDLIARGYGESSLYDVLVALKDTSGGVIGDSFLATLRACPAGSEIFTARLEFFAGLNNPVGINTNGSVMITSIYARDFFQKEGYSTYPNPYQPGTGRELFTRANAPEYYIDTGFPITGGGGNYTAFAIAWSLDKSPTTIVLSNEGPGYLIDQLIEAGHGGKSLYEVLQLLQPDSGGSIPQQFMDALAACPAGSEVFTAALHNFSSEFNNPIGINCDGSVIVAQINGKDFSPRAEYRTHQGNSINGHSTLFTSAMNPEHYIDAGSLVSGNEAIYYQAFTIIWASDRLEVPALMLSNEGPGRLMDTLVAQGHGEKSLYEVLQLLQPDSAGAIPQWFMDSLAQAPAGSDARGYPLHLFADDSNNPIGIGADGTCIVAPVYGRDYFGKEGYQTTPGTRIGSCAPRYTAASDANYQIDLGSRTEDSLTTYYKAFAIVWGQAADPEDLYRVTARVEGGHGTVSPASVQLHPGQQLSLKISPDAGYSVATIRDNGREMSPASSYTIEDIREDHQIVVRFGNEAPTVQIEAPLDGAAVSGQVTVTARVGDDLAVQSLTLTVDGRIVARNRPIATRGKSRHELSPEAVEQTRSFSWDSSACAPGPHTLTVTASDAAGASTSDTVQVSLSRIELGLSAERRTAQAWSISRDYGQLTLSVQNAEARIAAFRLLRRPGNGAFAALAVFTPGQLARGSLSYQDKYLEKNQAYSYRLEAMDASGQVLAQSTEVAL